METWKDIPGYEGLYQASDFGNIRSLNWGHRGEIKNLYLKPHNRGYLQVELAIDGHKNTYLVHRLVAMCFVPGFKEGLQVNHLNEDRRDNRAVNLEWVTQSENVQYSFDRKRNDVIRRVRKNYKPVAQISMSGAETVWACILDVVDHTGFNAWSIKQCCEGKRKQAYGYKWRYAV